MGHASLRALCGLRVAVSAPVLLGPGRGEVHEDVIEPLHTGYLAIYPAVTDEAHTQRSAHIDIHQTYRGTKHSAARALHTILTANDDRPATMHNVADRTDRELLPDLVAAVLDCNDERRVARGRALRQHSDQTRARLAALERLSATTQWTAGRSRNRAYGLEL
jgi:hypothetical protein